MQHTLKQLHQNEKGLTLVEVLAAMAILSIIVVAFLNISGYMTLAFSKSNEETEALRLAERILNEKKNIIDSSSPRPTALDIEQLTPVSFDGYKLTIYVNNIGESSPTYPLPSGTTKHVSVQAIVLLQESSAVVPRVLTVTVSWGETTP